MKLLTQDKLDAVITEYHWMVNAIKEMRAEMVIVAKRYSMGFRLHYR